MFTPGSPAGTWTDVGSQNQNLSESFLSTGASGIAVAQGTHLAVVTGEFGGNALTAIVLPVASGSGIPAISDWVTCGIAGLTNGDNPHTLIAYQSPSSTDAIAVLANSSATSLAVVDLTMMLNSTIVPRTAGGHGYASGSLPATVVSFISVHNARKRGSLPVKLVKAAAGHSKMACAISWGGPRLEERKGLPPGIAKWLESISR